MLVTRETGNLKDIVVIKNSATACVVCGEIIEVYTRGYKFYRKNDESKVEYWCERCFCLKHTETKI